MEETKKRKLESIVFAACIFVVSALLIYVGGMKNILQLLSVVIPPFGAALLIFSVNSFWIRICALVLFWIPQIILLKTADYAALFLPVTSLVFAASCISPSRTSRKTAAASLIISACISFACAIYNASQFYFKRYFAGRWNKLVVFLILLGLLFAFLRLTDVKVSRRQSKEKTILSDSRILFAMAFVDIVLGIETLFQFMWGLATVHHVYCLAWLLFLAGIIRYNIPQVARVMKKLKLD